MVGIGQGYYWTLHDAQDTPPSFPSKKLSDPKCPLEPTKVEKTWFRIINWTDLKWTFEKPQVCDWVYLGETSDTSSWGRIFLAPPFSSRSVNTFQCSHRHIIKDALVYFISWMSKKEIVASCLNNFQRMSVTRTLIPWVWEKWANISGNFPWLAQLEGYKQVHFQIDI